MKPDSFSLQPCEKNAAAEGAKNASFQRGNAVNMGYERVELIDTTDGSFILLYFSNGETHCDKAAAIIQSTNIL